MEARFRCPNCSTVLQTRFLDPGELAKCRACGESVPVPDASDEDVEPWDEAPPDPSRPPIPPNASGSTAHSQAASASASNPASAAPPPLPGATSTDSASWWSGRELQVGRLLSETLQESFLQFPRYAPLAAIAVFPSILGLGFGLAGNEALANFFTDGLGQWLSNILTALSSATIIAACYSRLRGQPISLGDAFAVGLSRWLPYFFLIILVGLIGMVATLLFVLPGIYAFLTLAIAGPALVLEEAGVTESMQRSSDLVSGHRWKLLGFYFALWFVAIILFIIFAAAVFTEEPEFSLIETVFVILFTLTGQIMANVSATVVYKELRMTKGEFDQNELISVFE